MNKLEYRVFYRRNLPHIQPIDGIIFVTYRLDFTLPAEVRLQIKNAKTNFADSFLSADEYLNFCKDGDRGLSIPEIAQIVFDSLLKMNHIQYDLFCFCIMPNHVHVLFKPLTKKDSIPYSLSEIMHGHKGATARKINLSLGRKGRFWHDEYYDHFIRDYKEFYNIAWYILNNPVKANLVSELKSWKFTWIEKQLEYDLNLDTSFMSERGTGKEL